MIDKDCDIREEFGSTAGPINRGGLCVVVVVGGGGWGGADPLTVSQQGVLRLPNDLADLSNDRNWPVNTNKCVIFKKYI